MGTPRGEPPSAPCLRPLNPAAQPVVQSISVLCGRGGQMECAVLSVSAGTCFVGRSRSLGGVCVVRVVRWRSAPFSAASERTFAGRSQHVTVVLVDRSEEHGGGSQGGSVRPPRVWAKAGSRRRRCVSAMRTQAPASSRVCRSRGAHPSVARAAYRTWCCPCSQEMPRACGTLTGADEVLGRRPAAGKPVRFHGADASSRCGSRSCFFLRVLFRGLEGASSPCLRGTQQRVKRPGLVERLWSDEAPSTSLPPSPPLSRGTWEFTRLHGGSAC